MRVYIPLLPAGFSSHPHPDGMTLLWRKDTSPSPSAEQSTIEGQLLVAWPWGVKI